MKSLIIGLGIALALATLCVHEDVNAESYQWLAYLTLVSGSPRNCGLLPYSNFRVRVEGNRLDADPVEGESQFVRKVHVNLSSLKPDGSGRVTRVTKVGVTWYWDFEAGSGPRKILTRRADSECGILWSP